LISIVLPNLNTDLKFLEPRIKSIINQSCTDWECIIVDGFSDNGSWQYLQEAARADKRFSLCQKPKQGIYNAWNEGIKLASGEYIYIATADDTMSDNFIDVMLAALEKHSECSIAHCCLQIINEQGENLVENSWDDYYPTQYFGDKMKRVHVRKAPHDGLLHAFIKTVYTSITQLLIKKELFDRVGLFVEDAGSIADMDWGMRASLLADVIHIPEYLATWRIHDRQATKDGIQQDSVTYSTLVQFVRHNYNFWKHQNASAALVHDLNKLLRVYSTNQIYYNSKKRRAKNKFHFYFQKFEGKSKPYINGLTEARLYFEANNLDSLIFEV
jgi:glycosyltransferase involved in cell wall biosynthesis